MEKYGWICPRCGKVNAPWVAECNCSADFAPWWRKIECAEGTGKPYEGPSYTTTTNFNNSNYSTQTDDTAPH